MQPRGLKVKDVQGINSGMNHYVPYDTSAGDIWHGLVQDKAN